MLKAKTWKNQKADKLDYQYMNIFISILGFVTKNALSLRIFFN